MHAAAFAPPHDARRARRISPRLALRTLQHTPLHIPVRAHRAPDPVPAEDPLPEPFDIPHPHHPPVHLPHDEEPVPDPRPS